MGEKYGFLIDDDFETEIISVVDMNIASIFWGFTLGVALFSAGKASKQTWRSWKRARRITAYVFMIWVVWLSSMIIGVLSWLFQRGYMKPSFGFFFSIVFFWCFQIQFLLQIIINRLGLLMVVPGRAKSIKWIVFIVILVINISVFCIWTPARLQRPGPWHEINEVWDRVEKGIFALIDGALNFYFIWLVKAQLIENGLTKYTPLFRVNICLVFVSLSLDVILIGLMSLPSSLVYLSFHPVAYLVKLQIEMKMAELITKIVRSTGREASDDVYYKHYSSHPEKTGVVGGAISNTLTNGHSTKTFRGKSSTRIERGEEDIELGECSPDGIRKTVETTIVASSQCDDDGDAESRSSSTRKLNYHNVAFGS